MQALKKISALFLAILVMYSSTSYALNMHYCMGELADVALFSADNACDMKVEKPICHQTSEQTHLDAQSCCEDQSFQIDAQDEVLPVVKSSLTPIQFVQIAIIYAPELLISASEQKIKHLHHYTPPLIVKDISLLHDTFLI